MISNLYFGVYNAIEYDRLCKLSNHFFYAHEFFFSSLSRKWQNILFCSYHFVKNHRGNIDGANFPTLFSVADLKTKFWKMICFQNFQLTSIIVKNTNNVWCIKFRSKHSTTKFDAWDLNFLLETNLIRYFSLRHPTIL